MATRIFVICASKDDRFFVRMVDQAKIGNLAVELDHV